LRNGGVPEDFATHFYEFDLRPGGAWRFTMHAPNGTDFPNESVFVEIVQPKRIVFKHLAPVHAFVATAEFAEEDVGTAIRFSMLFPTAAKCERSKRYVVQGNEENFDRLEGASGRHGLEQRVAQNKGGTTWQQQPQTWSVRDLSATARLQSTEFSTRHGSASSLHGSIRRRSASGGVRAASAQPHTHGGADRRRVEVHHAWTRWQ
jgi:hypothetical protein